MQNAQHAEKFNCGEGMVNITIKISEESYHISSRNCENSLKFNLYGAFKDLEQFDEEANLVSPEWFNSFHKQFLLEMKSTMSIVGKLKLRVFGTTVRVVIEDNAVMDDLILGTLYGVYEHLMRARIVIFVHNNQSIKTIKYVKSLEYLVRKYKKTKNEDYRIRSKIINMDRYYSE